MSKLFCVILFLFPAILFSQEKPAIKEVIHFPTASSFLTMDMQERLNQLAARIEDGSKVLVVGYTDAIGSDSANHILSQQRAQSIFEYLKTLDAENSKHLSMQEDWKGKADSLAPNDTEEGRAQNRRTEIYVFAPPYRFDSSVTVRTLYKRIVLPVQHFCVNNTRDTVLVARHGTLIYLKANTIEPPIDYECKPCSEIEVKEALFKDDIVAENLSTISNGQVISSQSMVSVRFRCGNTWLPLQEESNYVVLAPADQNGMANEAFDGSWSDIKGYFNWRKESTAQVATLNRSNFEECPELKSNDSAFQACPKCPLFFCRLGDVLKAIFDDAARDRLQKYYDCRNGIVQPFAENVTYAAPESYKTDSTLVSDLPRLTDSTGMFINTDSITSAPVVVSTIPASTCGFPDSIIERYGVQRELMTRQLVEASIANMKKNGTPVSLSDLTKLQYNVYAMGRQGWSNIDWMEKKPESELKNIDVQLEPSAFTDCKLVFKNKRVIVPGTRSGKGFTFNKVPANEPAYVVIINTLAPKGMVRVEAREIVTGEQTITPAYKTIPLTEFLSFLKKINE